MQTIKPSGSFVFAKPKEVETKTKTGILLTEKAIERPKTAEVINVGPTVKSIKPKSEIVYKEYTTSEIKLNGDDYILVHEEDILGEVLDVQEANA